MKEIGKEIDPWNDYKPIKIVGRGAHGQAKLCLRKKDSAQVVIKELFGASTDLTEIQVLSIVRHANIIAYFDSFTPILPSGESNKLHSPSSLCIVMEYADGGTLESYLASLKEPLQENQVSQMFCQIALAMEHVHSHNILHRDLKTSNVMISQYGNQQILKIGDFGISKLLSKESQAETVVGTPSYLSPELCEGKSYNDKSDVWAMGCILYEIMALQKMFDGNNLPAIVMKIIKGVYDPIPSSRFSNPLIQLVDSCVRLDPSSRPSVSMLLGLEFLQPCVLETVFSIGRLRLDQEAL